MEIPPKLRGKMESAQPDDLILVKAAFAATFAFIGKKVAVAVYDYFQSRNNEEDQPEEPEEEI